jgi:hypothetical protein
MKQHRVQKSRTKGSSKTTTDTDVTPPADRREIRKDIARTWWPDA